MASQSVNFKQNDLVLLINIIIYYFFYFYITLAKHNFLDIINMPEKKNWT
jgi:hypothetical protein